MSKAIEFSYKGVDYTLEFTKKTIEQAERSGFVAADVTSKPGTAWADIFYFAFAANHPGVKRKTVSEIYDHLPQKREMVNKLAEMYSEHLEALTADPDGTEGNAVEWKANWE